LDATDGNLRLEHLRFGADQPVFLFDLRPEADGMFSSTQPHVCQDDCYSARMVISDDEIQLTWTVAGPEKNETIDYRYR
jgi:hypothetical protein